MTRGPRGGAVSPYTVSTYRNDKCKGKILQKILRIFLDLQGKKDDNIYISSKQQYPAEKDKIMTLERNPKWAALSSLDKAQLSSWLSERYELECKEALTGTLTKAERDQMNLLTSWLGRDSEYLPTLGDLMEYHNYQGCE